MNIVHIVLVKALNELVSRYDNLEDGINYIDIRDFENYIISQGADIEIVNEFINKQ